MSLSLTEFIRKVSAIVIAHETAQATKRNEAREQGLQILSVEIATQEKKLAELQALAEQARQTLQDAEKEGVNVIEDPFAVLKKWAKKNNAWKGWEGEIKDSKSLPPLGWVRRSRNLPLPYFVQYESMHALVKQGKQKVFDEYIENLGFDLKKAQESLNKERQSYEFHKEKYESLKAQVRDFEQELERIREESTPKTQEDLEGLLEDAWEDDVPRDEILKLIPDENYTVQEEVQFTSVTRNYTIKLADAVLNFETCN